MAIVSVSVIVFRFNTVAREQEFLLICRKIRSICRLSQRRCTEQELYYEHAHSNDYQEKQKLKRAFDALWRDLWHGDVTLAALLISDRSTPDNRSAPTSTLDSLPG
jgi:hypothetical protein